MELVRLDGPDGGWCQGAFTVPLSRRLLGGPPGLDWVGALSKRLNTLIALAVPAFTLRWRISRKGPASLTVAIAAHVAQEHELRLVLAGIALLDGALGQSIAMATDAAAVETSLAALPDRMYRYVSPHGETMGRTLASGLRLFDVVDEVLALAGNLELDFTYAISVGREVPARPVLTELARHTSALESMEKVPVDQRARQHALFERAGHAEYRIEEFIGFESGESAETCLRAAANIARDKARAFPDAEFEILDDDGRNMLSLGLPSWLALGESEIDIGELFYALATRTDAGRMLSWMPVTCLEMLPDGAVPPAPEADAPPGPPLSDAGDAHFISYARRDAALVYPILDNLYRLKVPFWYDRHITPGMDWTAELESRLARARSVIAFLSPNSVESRYCRREIQYADIVNRPIYPVLLDDVTLRSGLDFILRPLQMFDARSGDIRELVSKLSASNA